MGAALLVLAAAVTYRITLATHAAVRGYDFEAGGAKTFCATSGKLCAK
jgi:hypothetical protein